MARNCNRDIATNKLIRKYSDELKKKNWCKKQERKVVITNNREFLVNADPESLGEFVEDGRGNGPKGS